MWSPQRVLDTLLRTFHTWSHLLLTSHFTDKAGSEGLSNLPKVPELIRKRFLSGARGCSSPPHYPTQTSEGSVHSALPHRAPLGTQHCVRCRRLFHRFQPLDVGFSTCGSVSKHSWGEYISYCVICFSQGHYTESKLRLFQTKPERQWLKSKTCRDTNNSREGQSLAFSWSHLETQAAPGRAALKRPLDHALHQRILRGQMDGLCE